MKNRMIRIFISSTFRDFEAERNLLHDKVFPQLSELCRKSGFSFQIIDLRWGISDEDAKDNRTIQICLEEIKRCQTLSPKPNFLIMSGNRYGWIPLPEVISSSDWSAITKNLTIGSEESALLSEWYKQDMNSVNGDYILVMPPDAEDNDKVKNILFKLSEQNLLDESLTKVFFGISATEQEIYNGLFLAEGAEKHTFVMLKHNGKVEECSDAEKAVRLQNSIMEYMRALPANICEYDAKEADRGDTDALPHYAREAKNFLEKVISEQINEILEIEKNITPFQAEYELLTTLTEESELEYINVNNTYDMFDEQCKSTRGGILLVKGLSGSGKSSMLRHWYARNKQYCAAAFSDMMPLCGSIAHALWFCAKQLEANGIVDGVGDEPDITECVKWFGNILRHSDPSKRAVIIIDSVEQLRDWNRLNDSLLKCRLPRNITLVICCISEASLTEYDRTGNYAPLDIPLLSESSANDMLSAFLLKYGRRLSGDIRLPKDRSPLYIKLASSYLKNLRSFDPVLPELPQSGRDIILVRFKEESKNYPVLFSHILGYIFLASDGLSEREMLELLEEDDEVCQEVLKNSKWDFKGKYSQPLSVLWAKIYYDLQYYLTEGLINGVALMRFNHSIIKETAGEYVGSDALMTLADNMTKYFRSDKQKYIYTDNDTVFVNERKLRELYPIIKYQDKWEESSALLSEPIYSDCFIRAGRYAELIGQFREVMAHTDLSAEAKEILKILRSKSVIFQTWNDSFSSACAGADINYKYQFAPFGVGYYFKDLSAGTDIPEPIIQIPSSASSPVALKGRKIIAAFNGDKVRLYDCDLYAETGVICEVESQSDIYAMYWKGDNLILRADKERITLRYTGSELYLVKSESCPTVTDFYHKNLSHCMAAGDETEFCAVNCSTHITFDHRENGQVKFFRLPYSDQYVLYHTSWHDFVAVLIDHTLLHIINIKSGKLVFNKPCVKSNRVFWSDDGSALMLTDLHDRVSIIPFEPFDEGEDMIIAEISREEYWSQSESVFKKYGEMLSLYTDAVHWGDRVLSDNTENIINIGSTAPLLSTFSLRRNWLACYYHYCSKSILRIYTLDTRRLIIESTVGPVFAKDSIYMPLRASEDGKNIILVSAGKGRVFDMATKRWTRESAAQQEKDDKTKCMIRSKYYNSIEKWLPKDITKVKKRMLGGIASDILFDILIPIFGKINKTDYKTRRKRAEKLSVRRIGQYYAIVDTDYNIVCVYDAEGKLLCSEQFGFSIAAADIIGETLYVLPENLGNVITKKFTQFK